MTTKFLTIPPRLHKALSSETTGWILTNRNLRLERRKDGICILSGTRQLSLGLVEWGVIKTTPTIRHLHNHRIPTTPDLLDPTTETLVTSTKTKAVMVEDLMEDLLATATIVEAFLGTLEAHRLEVILDITLGAHHLEAAVLALAMAAVLALAMAAEVEALVLETAAEEADSVLETAAEEAASTLAMVAEEAVPGLVVEAVEEVLTLTVKT